MSLDGSRVAFGAKYSYGNGINSGYVMAFDYSSSGGLTKFGSDIDVEAANDNSGSSVSMS